MRRRLCAECGEPLVPEGEWEPGAEQCPMCGAMRVPQVQAAAQPAVYAEPVEVNERVSPHGDAAYREVRQGPFVFRQYTRTIRPGTGQGPGCTCGCLVIVFLLFLLLRGCQAVFFGG